MTRILSTNLFAHHSVWLISEGSAFSFNNCVRHCALIQQSFYTKSSYSHKHCSTDILSANNSTLQFDSEEYKMFYKFPYIVHARVLNRLKLYQTIAAVIALPASNFAYYNDLASLLIVKYCWGIGTFACGMLYIMGQLFRSLIGIMYLNKEKTLVKVSHLTFWGKRKDIIIPVERIVPLLETSSQKKDLFFKLQTYDSNTCLYFSVKYGHIIEKEMFYHVFGSIENM